jgi:hypothetical protein
MAIDPAAWIDRCARVRRLPLGKFDIVTGQRLLLLIAGPLLLVGGAYVLSFPAPNRAQAEFAARNSQARQRLLQARSIEASALGEACVATARELQARLPGTCVTIVRPPCILAGDFGEAELDRLNRESVVPVMEALWRMYFDRRPDQPIVIVALSNETTYRAVARGLDGYEPTAYAGYTQRAQRRLVFNTATGMGTLTHELVHILALFDFPDMPEWFDEGLAALHEESVLSDDRLTLAGVANWRSRLLRSALDAGELPPLSTVVKSRSFRGPGENLNYAQARCFCLFLQERGLLSHFYRKFRAAAADDPSGLSTLCELLGASTARQIDRDFREWISRQPLAPRPGAGL